MYMKREQRRPSAIKKRERISSRGENPFAKITIYPAMEEGLREINCAREASPSIERHKGGRERSWVDLIIRGEERSDVWWNSTLFFLSSGGLMPDERSTRPRVLKRERRERVILLCTTSANKATRQILLFVCVCVRIFEDYEKKLV